MKKKISKRYIFCAAVILAIIIVPFLYSYFYLDAFWDPYSKLEKLPVAVVNNDKGAEINGKQRNLGDEMCDRFKKDKSLKFIFTDAKDAKAGTKGSDYYATISIPEDFSQNIASINTDNKQTAKITFSANEKRNYLASQILNRAVLEIEEKTRSTVDKEIVGQLADKIKDVPDQLSELQDGLGDLGDGSSKLLDGVDKLKDGSGKLSDGTATLSDGTKTLLNGASALSDGTGKLLDGTNTLSGGTKSLKDGTSTYYNKFKDYKKGVTSLKEGSTALASGAQDLQTGIGQLKSGSDSIVEKTKDLGQITSGAKTVADGTKTFDASLTQYTSGVNSLISTVNNTSTFLSQYVKSNPALLKDPTFAAFIIKLSNPVTAQSLKDLQAAGPQITAASSQLVTGTQQLYAGTAGLTKLNTALLSLSEGATKLQTGSATLTKGAKTLDQGVTSLSNATDKLYTATGDIANGAAKVNNGVNDLHSGANDLNSGANRLYSGVKDLNNGATDLNNGAGDLNKGVKDLKDGAGELNNGINEAKSGVDTAVTDAKDQIGALDGLADYASAPVSIEQKNVESIANYGTAFSPYFMSLSLWVGAIILFVGIYLDTEGKFKILSRESSHRLIRSFSFLLIGFIQAIVLALIVTKGLGLKVDNIFLFYTSVCLVSMSFLSIVQFLMVHLKSVGKMLSVVFLILQLTSCGGTFPMETVPKLFNVLFPYMPMTYSVALFKQAITDPNTSEVLYNGGILLAILVVFMALTIIISAIKVRRADKTEVQVPALEN